MLKPKPVIAVCISALSMSALMPATAPAATAGWVVNGTQLSGTRALATTAATDEAWLLNAAGVQARCAGEAVSSVGPQLISPNKASAKSVTITECDANANCKIPSSITFNPVLVEVTLDGSLAIKAVVKPATKTTFAVVTVSGEKCALLGSQSIVGQATEVIPDGTEKTLQLVQANIAEASNELKVGSSAASLKGSSLLRLAGGESWTFL